MASKKYKIRPVSKVFIAATIIALLFFAGIACYSSYSFQRESIVMQCDSALQDIFDHYYDKVYSLSDVYTPIFKTEESEWVMRSYFARNGADGLNYTARADLVTLLTAIMERDSDIEFIALFNPNAAQNFYLPAQGSQMKEIWSDLPLKSSSSRLQLLGNYQWIDENGFARRSFIIRGGAVPVSNSGSILIGYSTASFDTVLRRRNAQELATFVVADESGFVYDSSGEYDDQDEAGEWTKLDTHIYRDSQHQLWYANTMNNSGRVFTAAYMLPLWNMVRMSARDIPFLLFILACFALFVMGIYIASVRFIFNEVQRIQDGLAIIGGNHLDHRLIVSSRNDEFDEIAENINTMAELLKISTEKEYKMRMRETAAELNSVQARFDPHFLYNTLEIIRGKLFKSGDIETADYLEKLSRIFRNLTDAAPVMSIREEIAFCSLYMALLQLRFNNTVEVSYDVDVDLQECGILAHLTQPAIENYFMHALDETSENHMLDITCEAISDDAIRIVISDNGTGSDDQRIDDINRQLLTPVISDHGYGLMSIAKRIRLFYGEKYGVKLEKNEPCGMRVIITIPRMSVETHRQKLGIDP